MPNIPEFRNNTRALTDLIKFIPHELLYSSNLSWYVSPYDHIAIKLTDCSEIYHHTNIIFKGYGHIKIYFYPEEYSETPDPYIANLHFSKNRNTTDVQREILHILTKYGGFKIGG